MLESNEKAFITDIINMIVRALIFKTRKEKGTDRK